MATAAALSSIGSFNRDSFLARLTVRAAGVGLVYYGQNFLIYPSAFPPGSKVGVCMVKIS